MNILTSVILGFLLGILAFQRKLCAVRASRNADETQPYLWTVTTVLLSSMVVVTLLNQTGLAEVPDTLLFAPVNASIGGLVFGAGAVWARGTTLGLLYRTGAGRLHALTSLIAMTFSAMFAVDIIRRYALSSNIFTWHLPSITNLSNDPLLSTAIAGIAGIILIGVIIGTWQRTSHNSSIRKAVISGLLMTVILGLIWMLSGSHGNSRGLEELPGMTRISSIIAGGASQGSQWMAGLLLGVILGAGAAAWNAEKFNIRWPRFADPVAAVGGGVAMGVGTAIASGGSMEHIFTGPGLLSAHSAMFAIVMWLTIRFGLQLRS